MNVYLSEPQRQACINALSMGSRWLCGDIDVFMDLIHEGKFRRRDGGVATLSSWATHVEPGLIQLAHQTLDVSVGGGLHPLDPGAPSDAAMMHQWADQLRSLKAKRHTTLAAMPYSDGLERTSEAHYRLWQRTGTTPKTLKQTIVAENLSEHDVTQHYKLPKSRFKWSIPDKQVHVFQRTLDVYTRLLMGQWNELADLNGGRWLHRDGITRDDLERSVRMFQKELTGFEAHSSHGIHHPCLDPDAKIGFDVYKAIRHWDYVHRNGYGTHGGVATDSPWQDDTWPLVDGSESNLSLMPIGSFLVGNESRTGGNKFYLFENQEAYPEGAYIVSSYSPVSCLDAQPYVAQATLWNTPY